MSKARSRRIKKIIKNTAAKKKIIRKAPVVEQIKQAPKKEFINAQQIAVEQSKFSHPQASSMRRVQTADLPYQYDRDRMILQVRDPYWIHTYWEVKASTFERLKQQLKGDFYKTKRLLRVYDVSHITFDGKNAHRFFDIEVNEFANNWYINTQGPGRSWCVDYGLLLPGGKFITILRSNSVHTPLDGPSWITDEEWMIPDHIFARLYGMGFGLGRSSPVGKAWLERMKQAAISSPGIASMASPVKKIPTERKFWLTVGCELIVYGATECDAKVTVQGKPVNLRKDGTFTLRFLLPDGKQIIPVEARSADSKEKHSITPIINRETK